VTTTFTAPSQGAPASTPASPTRCTDIAGALAQLAATCQVPRPALADVRCWVRVAATDAYDAWLISWPAGGAVDFHDHGGSAGAIAVVSGELTEVRPASGARSQRVLSVGAVHDVSAEAVHDVLNTGKDRALSVHVYAPPLASMTFYDPLDLRPSHVVSVAPAEASSAGNHTGEWLEWTTAH
jgi:hypothetical protein